MRPTTPFRSSKYWSSIGINKKNNKSPSLRSSHIADHPPEKQFRIKNNFIVIWQLKKNKNDLFNKLSQLFKTTYEPNGYVDILKTEFLLKDKKIIYGPKILPL